MAGFPSCDPFRSSGRVAHSRIKPGVSYLDVAVKAAGQALQPCHPEQMAGVAASKPVQDTVWPACAQGSGRLGSSSEKRPGACQRSMAWKAGPTPGTECPALQHKGSVRAEFGRRCPSPDPTPVPATAALKYPDASPPEAPGHSRGLLKVTYLEMARKGTRPVARELSTAGPGDVAIPLVGLPPCGLQSLKNQQKADEAVPSTETHGRDQSEPGASKTMPETGTAEGETSEVHACDVSTQTTDEGTSAAASEPPCTSGQEVSISDQSVSGWLSICAECPSPPSGTTATMGEVDGETTSAHSTFLPFHSLRPAQHGESGTFLPFHSLRLGPGSTSVQGGEPTAAGSASSSQAMPSQGTLISGQQSPAFIHPQPVEAAPLNSQARPFLPFPTERTANNIAPEPVDDYVLHRSLSSAGATPVTPPPPPPPRAPPPPPPYRHTPRYYPPNIRTYPEAPPRFDWCPDFPSWGQPRSSAMDSMLSQTAAMPYYPGNPYWPPYPTTGYGGPFDCYVMRSPFYSQGYQPGLLDLSPPGNRGVLAYGVSTGDHLPSAPPPRIPPPAHEAIWGRDRRRARDARGARPAARQVRGLERPRPRRGLTHRSAEVNVRLGRPERERRRSAWSESLLDSVPPYTYHAPRGAASEDPGDQKGDADDRPAVLCAICYDGIVEGDRVRALPCCHKYHDQCIVPWLEKKGRRSTCPECIARVFQPALPSFSSGDSMSVMSSLSS